MNNETKLKPCPFCGSEEIGITSFTEDDFISEYSIYGEIYCHCRGCGARGHIIDYYESDDYYTAHKSAIEAWNNRAYEE